MTLLEVKALKKTYTTRLGGHLVPALTNVTFSVEKGEYLAIMGESGSGKTTLLNIVASLDQPTGGQVLLEGKDIGKIRERDLAEFRRKNLGFVFQDFNLLDTFSLRDNIYLPLVLSGMHHEEMARRLAPLAKKLSIEDILEKYPYEVSGGQKQRVAVARACITDPRLLLADEPTGALDSRSADQLLDLFEQINREGQTILMVTHSAKAASRASRVLFIKDGEVFHQLYRGGRTNEAMFTQIADTLTALATGVLTVGKLFFPKMAAGNLVRNRRFVFPYLLTGIITVAMFYNITFLAWHQEIRNMPGGDTIPAIMYLGTIVVGIFSIIFLLYTNSFLIKRRHKEIGLYNILGMSKRHIAVVLLWETLYTCLVTIVGGILLGILLSKLLLLLLYKILFFTVQFGFSVNFTSVAVTAALFAGIYLVALMRNLLHVSLSKPVELLREGTGGKGTENESSPDNSRPYHPGGRLLHRHHHRVPAGCADAVLLSRYPGHRRDLLSVYRRFHRVLKGHEKAEKLLLSGQAFYWGLGDALSNEAKCRGSVQYLYSFHHGLGDALYLRVYVSWGRRRSQRNVSP